MSVIINAKTLNQRIAALGKRTTKWRNDVQSLLVSCAFHAFEHNNTDPLTNLVKVLHGADLVAVIHWAEKHCPAVWQKAETKFRFNKSFQGEFSEATLMEDPWYIRAVKAKEVASSLDMLESLRGFIKRMEKEVELEVEVEVDGVKTKQKRTLEHAELLAKVKALANDVEYATK
jgi:hypothetical protein